MSHDSPLAAKRILVVEDEYFIARDLERALRAADAIVIGPVATLEQFLVNREAFLLDKDNPNAGYRYLRPPRKPR